MIFFTDENFPVRAAELVAIFDRDNEVRKLIDWFERGTDDVDWIASVGDWQPKPAVVCCDSRILRNRVERRVLREADLTFVCLAEGWANTPWDIYAWKIIKAWPAVVAAVSRVRRPTVFQLSIKSLKMDAMGATADL